MSLTPSSSLTLRPLLDLQLNGETNLSKIITDLTAHCNVRIKIISAQLEYVGNANFGNLQLHLLGDESENQNVIDYFDHQRIRNTITSYAAI